MPALTQRLLAAIATPKSPAIMAMLLVVAAVSGPSSAASGSPAVRPTVVLVHGAFADSSSWDKVSHRLLAKGYRVVAAANPLRSVKGDGAYVADLLDAIDGPVILVGHSYGGNVISVAATGKRNVKALVYVAGFAPEAGESAASLSEKFPGSTLGGALAPPVVLADGSKDLYIRQEEYHAQFADDVSIGASRSMAVTQRPITEAALNESSTSAAWKTIPSWFLYGGKDKNIPPAAHAYMAVRAGAREAVRVEGASHVVMISHPDLLVRLIDRAAAYAAH